MASRLDQEWTMRTAAQDTVAAYLTEFTERITQALAKEYNRGLFSAWDTKAKAQDDVMYAGSLTQARTVSVPLLKVEVNIFDGRIRVAHFQNNIESSMAFTNLHLTPEQIAKELYNVTLQAVKMTLRVP